MTALIPYGLGSLVALGVVAGLAPPVSKREWAWAIVTAILWPLGVALVVGYILAQGSK